MVQLEIQEVYIGNTYAHQISNRKFDPNTWRNSLSAHTSMTTDMRILQIFKRNGMVAVVTKGKPRLISFV